MFYLSSSGFLDVSTDQFIPPTWKKKRFPETTLAKEHLEKMPSGLVDDVHSDGSELL